MINYDVTTAKAELSYDVCEKCGSLWLDAGELNKMAFQVQGSIEFSSDEKVASSGRALRKCPRCDDFVLSQVKFLGATDIVLEQAQVSRLRPFRGRARVVPDLPWHLA
jgi:ribosomal protein S27AE